MNIQSNVNRTIGTIGAFKVGKNIAENTQQPQVQQQQVPSSKPSYDAEMQAKAMQRSRQVRNLTKAQKQKILGGFLGREATPEEINKFTKEWRKR